MEIFHIKEKVYLEMLEITMPADFETKLVEGNHGDEPPGEDAAKEAGAWKDEAGPALQEKSHCEAGLVEGPDVVACKSRRRVKEVRMDSAQIGENSERWQGFQVGLQAVQLPIQDLLLLVSLWVSSDKQQRHLGETKLVNLCANSAPGTPSTGARVGARGKSNSTSSARQTPSSTRQRW